MSLIYQADVRCRLKHSERWKRLGKEAHDKAIAAGGTHDFNTNAAWGWVWQAMVGDSKFGHRKLEEPALLIMALGSKLDKRQPHP